MDDAKLHSMTNVRSTNIHWAPTVPDSEDANIKKTKLYDLQDKLNGTRNMYITQDSRMWDTEVYPSYGESTEESDPAQDRGRQG